jgi:glycosyltransferase involved in cell wall biosynthesis
MNALFFVGDAGYTARARIFVTAAHALAERGHEVTIACPTGPIIDRIDSKQVSVVRIDPEANAAFGTFDFRRVAQDRALDAVFVHTRREQMIVGSGLKLGSGSGALLRRLPVFEPAEDESGFFGARLAPATLIVTSPQEAATLAERQKTAILIPLGVDSTLADTTRPLDRRTLRLREDAVVLACPYSPHGRLRALSVLRTLALLAPRHPRLRVVLYGEEATADDLRMQAAALGVAPLCQFMTGDALDPVALMRSADFTWIAADHDAAALGCLDAMACGVPVVAERFPVTEHYVADGSTGVLLPEGEPAIVASVVANVVSRPDLRVALGAAGRARATREFPYAAMVDGFERAAISAMAGLRR